MSHHLSGTPAELRASLLMLLEACPVDHAKPEACPFYPLWQLPLPNRQRYLGLLSHAELTRISSYHHHCLKLKCECFQLANP